MIGGLFGRKRGELERDGSEGRSETGVGRG